MNTATPSFFNTSAEQAPLQYPLTHIALAFSGGGFRASSYALGLLAYFNEVIDSADDSTKRLLHQIVYISSTSGGTITNAAFTLAVAKGESFDQFYCRIYQQTGGVQLVNRVFELLNTQAPWEARKDKRRNLINAFALCYDELLFNGQCVEDLKQQNASPLEEVCFNSTEFHSGLLFRQSIKVSPKAKSDDTYLYGNFMINIAHDAVLKLKLADLLAASSCFPGGFEPIVFPGDFSNDKVSKQTLLTNLHIKPQGYSLAELNLLYGATAVNEAKKKLNEPVSAEELKTKFDHLPLQKEFKFGLMDGGIDDNQGLESMITANQRRMKPGSEFEPFNLMLINDVGSHFMSPYEVPNKTGSSFLTIRWLLVIGVLLCAASMGVIAFDLFGSGQGIGYKIMGILAGLVFTGSVLGIGALLYARSYISGTTESGAGLNLNKNFSRRITKRMLNYFSSTPISILKVMLESRAKSLMLLTGDVFMNRVRHLLYESAYRNKQWDNRIKSNHIYDLSLTNDVFRSEFDPNAPEPSREMQLVAETAFQMATTLWFDTNDQHAGKQGDVVSCGMFTTCYNLLVYIQRLKKQAVYETFDETVKARLTFIEEQLNTHFNKFKKNPYWLLNEIGKRSGIKDWQDQHLTTDKLPAAFNGLR